MKKIILFILIILAVIVAIFAGILIFINKLTPETPPVAGGNSGIVIISLGGSASNEEIFSPLKIVGYVTGKDSWTGFEGQVGTVRLLDSRGNQLALGILTATTDWMSPPVSFETVLNFLVQEDQNGTLVFHNENASGLPDMDKEFSMPIKIKATSQELTELKVYFNNSNMDPEASCNKVFAVERVMPKVEAIGSAALKELFKGPTQDEKNQGFFTSINDGVLLKSLMIGMESGTAWADFNSQLEYQVGGSCRVSAIRAQIEQTLKQFSTIKNVVISIDGRTEDILQP
ncbi:MAG: hypothetical protein A2998_01580 [Candidatus Staskawiczbacteria bacterium RIFCSPLOWO2_01_FULL_37_25b]|uniref:GerMN domain-containing protein n=2 Tax=Candidatus Staskawicziibacteriota TaxID=1817916 RepID=A0A1G2HLS4_9BACT|nr:MAG: hypothetical protein A2812_02700 [Candidatus Staskawiczbacteria bacterium RIFCSPHIGHO2_01_FULL_36_16]OGZ74241.1 MAG: hypothetical protein A2998_01580 [Candidatus Staskawiczbacteria bacterium RIFCSPLOWO2_01_FULL_37_25b]